MREFLVACRDGALKAVIKAGIGNSSKTEFVTFDVVTACLEAQAYDYLFVELAVVPRTDHHLLTLDDFKALFDPIWRLRPSIKIIVIVSPDQIQAGIAAVEGGAASYLKLPLGKEEVEFISRDVYEGQILESELDYLREQFWETDVREIVRTRCGSMKKVYDLIK